MTDTTGNAQNMPSPATVEVVRNAFISGAEQMRRNLYRSAHSPVIYEAKDCSVGIFDTEGRLLGQAPGLPFFLGSLGGTLREVIRIKGYEVFQDGDVWIVNDSSIAGSHLNDVTVYAPIFVDGSLRGFTAAKAHWNDIGAKEAGFVGDTTDIFQEGLRIGPTCIFRDGRLDQQIVDLIALNSRFPTALVGDLMAEISACRTGMERFRSITQAVRMGSGREVHPCRVRAGRGRGPALGGGDPGWRVRRGRLRGQRWRDRGSRLRKGYRHRRW